jgi:uncharacterized protein YcaQ
MKPESISLETARRLMLRAQLLDGRADLPAGKEGAARVVETLGYIQIDTISVIRRSHHHTLWTRRPDYAEAMLHDLQAGDRRVFEYWGHAMCYMPMSDYRYVLPRMRNFQRPQSQWARYSLERCGDMLQPVLDRIRAEGPLSSRDFAPPPGTKRGTWWDWKPAKFALELLFWKGDLMITERRNFQKYYDLTERVLPGFIDTSFPGKDEMGMFLVRRALSAFGTAQEKEIRKFMQPGAERDSDVLAAGKKTLSRALAALEESGEAVRVRIDNGGGDENYALREVLEKAASLDEAPAAVLLLSPFDNLMILRERVKRLFGFNYFLECYVPAAKRKFGYFALAILWKDGLVGRIDPKADTSKKTLLIRNMAFEEGFRFPDGFLSALAGKLADLARFNNCRRVKIEKAAPAKIGRALQALVNRSE